MPCMCSLRGCQTSECLACVPYFKVFDVDLLCISQFKAPVATVLHGKVFKVKVLGVAFNCGIKERTYMFIRTCAYANEGWAHRQRDSTSF